MQESKRKPKEEQAVFDVTKVQNMLKEVSCLEDLTGPNGVMQEKLYRYWIY